MSIFLEREPDRINTTDSNLGARHMVYQFWHLPLGGKTANPA